MQSTRRDLLKLGSIGLASLTSMGLLKPDANAALIDTVDQPIDSVLTSHPLADQALASRVLKFEVLPADELPQYSTDLACKSFLYFRNNIIKQSECENVLIPLDSSFTPEQWDKAMFRLFDAALNNGHGLQGNGKQHIIHMSEDAMCLQEKKQKPQFTSYFIQHQKATPYDAIHRALTVIEEHELIGATIIGNQKIVEQIFGPMGSHIVDYNPEYNAALLYDLYGHIFTADIWASNDCPRDQIYVTAAPEYIGVIVQHDRMKEYPSGRYPTGMAIINDYTIARINFDIDHRQATDSLVIVGTEPESPYIKKISI